MATRASSSEILIQISPSKSLSQRAILAEAASDGRLHFDNISDCDDSRHLKNAIDVIRRSIMEVDGRPVFSMNPGHIGGKLLDVGEGGTTLRFAMAYAAALPGSYIRLTGSPRLMERPIQPLVDALSGMGAAITEETLPDGRKAWLILGSQLKGGVCDLDASLSSQFVSALLLISPMYRNPLKLRFNGKIASRRYLDMTVRCMEQWGKKVTWTEEGWLKTGKGNYRTKDSFIYLEGDWSTAAFLYEYILLKNISDIEMTPFSIYGLKNPEKSLQPDSACHAIFRRIHSLYRDPEKERKTKDIGELDMGDTPDLVPALVATMLNLGIRFRLRDVGNLRLKESDRLEVLVTQWRRMGYDMCIVTDREGIVSLVWNGEYTPKLPDPNKEQVIDTAGDHRIAMSFAMTAGADYIMRISDAACVSKSEPRFWDILHRLGHRVDMIDETGEAIIYP